MISKKAYGGKIKRKKLVRINKRVELESYEHKQ